jgi:hypothetical protein
VKLTELFSGQLEREVAGTRKALERVPEGRNDWKPHPKSMPLGYLAALVARMPSWVAMTITTEELDLKPVGGTPYRPQVAETNRELVELFDRSLVEAREALAKTNDDHLMKPWRFLVSGQVVSEQPRYVVLTDAVFAHLAHHRGQLTVYLRLNEAAVPAIYGPSADEGH